jgi:hypothetical protein
MAMERVRFITHAEKNILFLNFAGCPVSEVLAVIDEAKQVIRTRPPASLLTLTDVTDARFDATVTERMKEFAAHNKPYVRAAAIVGITGLKKVIFEAALMFSKRKIHIFENAEDAKAWLATA